MSGVTAAGIASVSLYYLIKYVEATQDQLEQMRLQVEISQDQLEGSIRPIVVVKRGENFTISISVVSGAPALNLTYETYTAHNGGSQRVPIWVQGETLSGGEIQLLISSKTMSGEEAIFEVDYESSSGQAYQTTADWSGEGYEPILSFHKLRTRTHTSEFRS